MIGAVLCIGNMDISIIQGALVLSSGSYWQVYVLCPFYQSDDGKRRIVCEGITADSNLSQYFRKKNIFETQMKVFCCKHYSKCELYRLLMEKYIEEE